MKLLFVITLAVSVALSTAWWHPTECGPLQRLKVKHQWAQAFDFAEHREELDEDIWDEIFHLHPEWREEFFKRVRGSNTHSPEFRAHAMRIIGAFDMMITMLDEPDALQAEIEHLGHKHHEMHIPETAFEVFRKALMHAVQKRLGFCFNYDAWDLCTHVIEDGIAAIVHADAAAK